MVQKNFYIIV